MKNEKCPCCLRPWRCKPDRPFSTYITAKVTCPDCKATFVLPIPKREYRRSIRDHYRVPEVVCLACQQLRLGEERNPERAAV